MSLDKNYLRRCFLTFCPKILFNLSVTRFVQRRHWQKQGAGTRHGYDKYDFDQPKRDRAFTDEIKARAARDEAVLELGCNCGRDLFRLKQDWYLTLTGVDICANALEYGKKKFDLSGIQLVTGCYEDVLPKFLKEGRKFNLVYSGGASISLVHPSFDIVKHMCALSDAYVIMLNEDNQDRAYSRFWECEFRRYGFMLMKYLRPAYEDETGSGVLSSIAVFKRMK